MGDIVMGSELEEVAETATELVKDKVKENKESKEEWQWINWVAISTMIMALFSALGALWAGVTANDMMLDRTQEILDISYLEGDRLDIEILKLKRDLLDSLGKNLDKTEIDRIHQYEVKNQTLNADSKGQESQVKRTIFEHEWFAIGVTLLSIAITLAGMSIITRHKFIWVGSLLLSFIGTIFLGIGVHQMFS